MTQRTFAQVYATYDEAVQAVYDLERAGIAAANISLVGADSDPRVPDSVTRDSAESPAGLGATIGATAGGGAGLLAGIGAIVIPGIGPLIAAGWLVATLAGAGIGAAAGGVVGALTRLGVTDEQAHRAKDAMQHGGTVVMVRVDADRAEAVEAILQHDHRADAAFFADASPVIETAGSETSTVPADGDAADELARIERERDRIEHGG